MTESEIAIPAFPALITLAAVIQYQVYGFMVGRARAKYDVPAPATYGKEEFERIFRVHQNTLEQLIVFLPGLWIFTFTVSDLFAGLLGVIWMIGRELYCVGYMKHPDKRSWGFGITFLSSAILVIGGLVGLGIQFFH